MESQEKYVVISRIAAKNEGLSTYYTGNPCKRGHLAPRKVNNYNCVVCQKEYDKDKQKEYYQKHRKHIIEKQRLRNLAHSEEVQEYQKQYRKANAIKRLEYNKRYYQLNKDEQIKKSREHRKNHKEYYVEYNKQYYEDNKEQILASSRIRNKHRYQNNKEEINKKTLERYHNASPERIEERKQSRRVYRESQHGRGILNACGAKRRANKRNATPSWYEHDKCKKLYQESARLTKETGFQYNVDHIIPLQHGLVCGLHCYDNLQIITVVENLTKGNKFIID